MKAKKIGTYLVESRTCSKQTIKAALERQSVLENKGIYKPIGQIIMESGSLSKDTLDHILRKQGKDMLRSVALFKSLPPELLSRIADMAEFKAYPKGDIVIHEGDEGNSFYHIISGSVRVFQTSENGIEVTLNTLNPGESFGEMALLTGEPRSASVDTQDVSCFLVISKQAFERVVSENPEFSLILSKILSSRLARGSHSIVNATVTEKAYQRFVSEQSTGSKTHLIGRSRLAKQLRSKIVEVAQNDNPILISGETGTEKSDVAGLIHEYSNKNSGPFLVVDIKTVNMGRVVTRPKERDPIRLELAQSSTLFGHAPGALPFALDRRLGLFQVGDGGTVVIENIEHLADSVQKKLLDYILNHRFKPMGSPKPLHTSVRVVATSSVDLDQKVRDGRFNAKLFDLFRNGQTLIVPPLRKRKKDLRLLVDHMLKNFSEQLGKPVPEIDQDVYKSIMAYDWPGNADELRIVIRRAVSLARGDKITPEDILIGTPSRITGKLSFNVLKLDRVQQLFQSRRFPVSAQLVTAFFFILIIFLGFFGSRMPNSNLALVLTWGLWEPIVVLSCIPAAKIWCAVCPVGASSSLISRKYGRQRNVPSFIRSYGVYLSAIGLGLIFFAEVVFNMPFSPPATAVLILSITLPAVVLALIYQRRVWCRFLCPLGKLVGFLSSCSVLELRANQNICNSDCVDHACYVGDSRGEGCPVFEAPFAILTNQNCILCGNCIKNCSNQSPVLNLRMPGHELWSFRTPDHGIALFGPLIIGTQIFRGLDKTSYFHPYTASLNQWWFFSLILMAATIALSFMFVRNSSNGVFDSDTFTLPEKSGLLSYAFVPLAVSFELSFHFERLIHWGGQFIPVLGRQLGFQWDFLGLNINHWLVTGCQILFVLIGALASKAILKRIVNARQKTSIPHLSLKQCWPILFLTVVYILLLCAG